MSTSLTFSYSWSHPYYPTEGMKAANLKLIISKPPGTPEIQNLRLFIQTSDYIKIEAIHSYPIIEQYGEFNVLLGAIRNNEVKIVEMELLVLPQSKGRHSVLLVAAYYDQLGGMPIEGFSCQEIHAFFTDNTLLLEQMIYPQSYQDMIKGIDAMDFASEGEACYPGAQYKDEYKSTKTRADRLHLASIKRSDTSARYESEILRQQLQKIVIPMKICKRIHNI